MPWGDGEGEMGNWGIGDLEYWGTGGMGVGVPGDGSGGVFTSLDPVIVLFSYAPFGGFNPGGIGCCCSMGEGLVGGPIRRLLSGGPATPSTEHRRTIDGIATGA